jgi:hypothetical protein
MTHWKNKIFERIDEKNTAEWLPDCSGNPFFLFFRKKDCNGKPDQKLHNEQKAKSPQKIYKME